MQTRDDLIDAAVRATFHVKHGSACDCIIDGEFDDDTLLQAAVDAAEGYAPEEVRTLGRWLLLSPDERAEAFGHVCDARSVRA